MHPDSMDRAIEYARSYRQENQAAVALRILADAVLELRAENRVLREFIPSGYIERLDAHMAEHEKPS